MRSNLDKKISNKVAYLKSAKITMPKMRAFSVHLLTASGSFLAFLSLVAVSEKNWVATWIWLGLALFVDGIDGPIARKLEVKSVLPTWSGETLDNIIDYVTYVLIPVFALYQSGLLEKIVAFWLSALVVVTSAIYYADTGMKTEENFFKGFPVVWNMIVFTLFAVQPAEWLTSLMVFISAILSFFPIYFVHPIRVKRLRLLTLFTVFVWAMLGIIILFYYHMQAPFWASAGILASGLYLYCIGALLQFCPFLGKKVSYRAKDL